MVCAAALCSSHLHQFASASRAWTSDGPRQDVFSGKRDLSLTTKVGATRSAAISASGRSGSSAATGFNGRCPQDGCLDKSCPLIPAPHYPGNNSDAITGNVERWVEECVHEIVRNIQDAPFLQYIFDSQKKPSRVQRSHRQKISADLVADPSCWPAIRDALSKGADPPDGVILVQKLLVEPGQQGAVCCLATENQGAGDEEAGIPRLCPQQPETNAVWGVLVQPRGGGSDKNVCYLLKTTMVASSVGVCTRYCLTRATCFGPSYVEQLENAWLL